LIKKVDGQTDDRGFFSSQSAIRSPWRQPSLGRGKLILDNLSCLAGACGDRLLLFPIFDHLGPRRPAPASAKFLTWAAFRVLSLARRNVAMSLQAGQDRGGVSVAWSLGLFLRARVQRLQYPLTIRDGLVPGAKCFR
jgi:hypothetical protein